MSTDAGSLYKPQHQLWHRWLTGSTFAIAVAMMIVDHPLKTNHAPLGIISLQLAMTTAEARIVINDWHGQERITAAFGLGLDYLFMLSYGAWFYFGCRWAADRWRLVNPSRGTLFGWLAYGALLAVLLDAIENVFLLIFLQTSGRSVLYPIAFWCAVPKFLLILMSISIWVSGNFTQRGSAAAKPAPAKK